MTFPDALKSLEGYQGGNPKYEEGNMSTKRRIDQKRTKQVRLDAEIVRRLKIMAAQRQETIKSLVEGNLADLVGIDYEKSD